MFCYHSKEDEMLKDSEAREEHVVLRTQSKGVSGLAHVAPDVVPIDLGVAGSGGEQSCQHGHGRGLASSVVSQQSSDLALIGIEAHIVHSHHLLATTEHLPQTSDLHSTPLGGRLVLKQRLVTQLRVFPIIQWFCRVSKPVGFLKVYFEVSIEKDNPCLR